ncbi:PilW family protein [Lysinibacillus sp. 54212]|uniref:PilW family protein n=1 Tax=Lysinibacillus sp. 54212 TaxID=3119829 RepID=UPI002FCC4EDC
MKEITSNEKGLTLIELLATVVILFIVSLFIYNIIFSANKQNKVQVSESIQINDSAYILKQITKDIRKTYNITIDPVNPNRYFFNDKDNNKLVEYTYSTDNQLSRNGSIMANKISSFKINSDTTNDAATVTFKLNDQTYETTLIFRRGDE